MGVDAPVSINSWPAQLASDTIGLVRAEGSELQRQRDNDVSMAESSKEQSQEQFGLTAASGGRGARKGGEPAKRRGEAGRTGASSQPEVWSINQKEGSRRLLMIDDDDGTMELD